MQTALFFNGWDPLVRIIVAACVGYIGLILLIRISGKRTLAQLNAFDFVVTVAFGSTLATVIVSKSVALLEGLLALAMLVLLQFVIAWSATRSTWVSGMVKSEPRLVFHKGRYLDEALKAERVGREEVRQILRSQGIAWVGLWRS